MIEDGSWQADLLDALSAGLKADPDVNALVLTGSLADDAVAPDAWSDVDMTAIVADEAVAQRASQRPWLEGLGAVLGLERRDSPRGVTFRICLAPARRIDITLARESVLREAAAQEGMTARRAHKLLWSKSPGIDKAIPTLFPRPTFDGISLQSIAGIIEDFWLKASVAVAKTKRCDLLIAAHPALDLVRDFLVLQLIAGTASSGRTSTASAGSGTI